MGYTDSYNQLSITRLIHDTTFAQQNYWHPVSRSVSYAAGADVALTKRQTLGGQLRGSQETTGAQVSSASVATAPNGQPVGCLVMSNPKNSFARDVALNLN